MNCLEIPLDIAGVKIEGVEFTEQGEIFVTISSTIAGTACHVCGQKISDFYGQDREIILRHLSILGNRPTSKSGLRGIGVCIAKRIRQRRRNCRGMNPGVRRLTRMKTTFCSV